MQNYCRPHASKEEGNISLFFALSLVALIFFIGLAIDISMVLIDRSQMDNLCQVVSEDRFVHEESFRFAQDPATETAQYVKEELIQNHFVGHYIVSFSETERADNYRHVVVRVTLSKNSSFYFLKIFGASEVAVSSSIEFEDDYGEKDTDVVWAPRAHAVIDKKIEGDIAE